MYLFSVYNQKTIIMGLRLRKISPIFKGVKLNYSKTGVSLSLGKKGASINLGKDGIKTTIGKPGSGVSYSEQLSYDKILSNAPAKDGKFWQDKRLIIILMAILIIGLFLLGVSI